ncbi:retinaldehyde-binding protein 1-like [Mercenaria mercenaria]|uniref:retinaldehyde-binding protein 1-like n=1 Tax=Mercenaria mercenaria TaxID=6596 RepID=UPI001E1D9A67|nr:retinaldehyde-binding protein 1-like [Mercenaria mercenaria]
MSSTDDFTGTLDEESQQRAKKELNEDEKNRAGAVDTLRQWAMQQKWLKTPTDTKFLVKFLRVKKYSQLEARKALERYWKVRSSIPEWFSNKDPRDPKIQDVFDKGFMLRLPRVDKLGRIYVLQRTGCLDPDYITDKKKLNGSDAIFRAATALIDWVTMDERAQVNGMVVILDITGYSLKHKLVIHTTDNVKRFTSILPTNPNRVKGIHMYNLPLVFETVLTLVKTFMKQKLKDRIQTHGQTLVSLYDSIDMSVLPAEYLPDDYTGPCSGTLEEIIAYNKEEITKQPVVDYIMDLTSPGKYGVDSKLKPAEDDVPSASFRKLNVD